MTENLISLKGLNVNDIHGKSIVQGVSLELSENEFVGIVGESGSGKTVSVRGALGLLPEDLKVSFEDSKVLGKPMATLTERERRTLIGKGVGYVPQNTVAFLHPMIKIKHQIYDAYIYHNKSSKSEALKKAEKLLLKVGIKEPKRILNSYPIQISGGMKQRVNIAMALMTDPKVIIADEPTTALDTVVQKQVMQLFHDLYLHEDVSILFISHDLKIIKQFCQRVYVMYHGKVVEEGETDEIFKQPKHYYTKRLIRLIPSLHPRKNTNPI